MSIARNLTRTGFGVVTGAFVVILAGLLASLVYTGCQGLLKPEVWTKAIVPMALNSVVVTVISTAIAVLIGLSAAIAIGEMLDLPGWLRTALHVLGSIGVGMPAITFGVAGAVLMRVIGLRYSWFAGSITVGLMLTPLAYFYFYECLKSVASDERTSAAAMGFTRWHTAVHVMSCCRHRLVEAAGTVALRAIGDAAAVVFTAGSASMLIDFRAPGLGAGTLATEVYLQLKEGALGVAAACAVALVALALATSVGSRILGRAFMGNLDRFWCVARNGLTIRWRSRAETVFRSRLTNTKGVAMKIDMKNVCVAPKDGSSLIMKDVTLTFSGTGVTVIMGPSGCGKSTILSLITRLMDDGRTASGSVSVDGVDVRDLDPVALRRRVALVLQSPVMFAGSAVDNIVSVLRVRRVAAGEEARERARRALELVGLWGEPGANLVKGEASQLSGGQKQRLAIARALALEPEAILFDEPTSALDPGATAQIGSIIRELGKERLVVVVTHAHDLVECVAPQRTIRLERDPIDGATRVVSDTQRESASIG